MIRARKDSWKIEPMPPETSELEYRAEFTLEEHERISRGLIPQEMEDKWFVYLDGDVLNLHRSWTGFCMYQVELGRLDDGYSVRRARVNRNQAQYNWTEDGYDARLLRFLVDALLLGRPAVFPLPAGLPSDAPPGLYQHHVCGKAFPESKSEPG